MALTMTGSLGNHIKLLSKHTATTIYYTCNGIGSLSTSFSNKPYVLLGQFTTDPLEKEFCKSYQGSSSTYFNSLLKSCISNRHLYF